VIGRDHSVIEGSVPLGRLISWLPTRKGRNQTS